MKLLGVKIAHAYHSEARVFATLLRNRQSRYKASVFYHAWPNQEQGAGEFERDAGIGVIRVDTGWRPNDGSRSIVSRLAQVAKQRIALGKLVAKAREERPDAVYSSQQTWDNLVASHIAKALGKPHIIHLHYVPDVIPHNNKYQRDANFNLLNCDFVVTVSEFITERVVAFGTPKERVRAVRNTIEVVEPRPPEERISVRAEFGLAEDAPLIGIVGRVEEWKGQPDTIEAFAQIADRFPKAHLLVVGEGGYLETGKRLTQEKGLASRIHFTGNRSDVPRLLGALDVFSHPSRFDPAPLAVLEACASGLPVVAYAEGGVCEFVAAGETGLLTPPESYSGLAEAFVALLEDPAKARRMGAASRERIAAEFRPDQSGARFADILESVVAKGRISKIKD